MHLTHRVERNLKVLHRILDWIEYEFVKAPMKRVLFNCFIFIFLITAVITLGGIVRLLPIEQQYLEKLFFALILELVGAVVGLFTITFRKGISEVTNYTKDANYLDIPLFPFDSKARLIAIRSRTEHKKEQWTAAILEDGKIHALSEWLKGKLDENVIRIISKTQNLDTSSINLTSYTGPSIPWILGGNRCKNCGFPTPAEVKYCPKCGKHQNQQT